MSIIKYRWNYNIAVSNGFEGTEEEWLKSIAESVSKSAYDIAVENGFVGTEEEWLDSLKGEPGTIPETEQIQGGVISFDSDKIYNSPSTPATGALSTNFTNARIGIVQKIYHTSSAFVEPTNWVKLGTVEYANNELNIIYAEYCSPTRIEYWITQ